MSTHRSHHTDGWKSYPYHILSCTQNNLRHWVRWWYEYKTKFHKKGRWLVVSCLLYLQTEDNFSLMSIILGTTDRSWFTVSHMMHTRSSLSSRDIIQRYGISLLSYIKLQIIRIFTSDTKPCTAALKIEGLQLGATESNGCCSKDTVKENNHNSVFLAFLGQFCKYCSSLSPPPPDPRPTAPGRGRLLRLPHKANSLR